MKDKEYYVANFTTFVSKSLTFFPRKMDKFNFWPAQYCINKMFELTKSCIWAISYLWFHAYDFSPNCNPLSSITIINHNHYNFLKCDWCISCFIFHLSFFTVVIGQCNRTVGCNRIVEAVNHTKSTRLNRPITEPITITIATTTYPDKKRRISKMGDF